MATVQKSIGIDDALIEEIVRRVPVGFADRIILFGSAATGKMTRDSDIDLLVVDAQANDQSAGRACRSATPCVAWDFRSMCSSSPRSGWRGARTWLAASPILRQVRSSDL